MNVLSELETYDDILICRPGHFLVNTLKFGCGGKDRTEIFCEYGRILKSSKLSNLYITVSYMKCLYYEITTPR